MGMLLLLSQQWMEFLNAGHKIRAISLELFCVLLTRSGTLPCSPNSLPVVSKAISTHGSQTSSPVAANAWPLMVFSHPLIRSRLEFLKAALWALFFFWFSSMISQSLENSLYLFSDDSTLCRTICHPSDQHAAASSLTADLGKITNWSNNWNITLSHEPRQGIEKNKK